jgi:hypothetical protein
VDKFFDDFNREIEAMAERLETDPKFILAHFSRESGWNDPGSQAKQNLMGYMRDGVKMTLPSYAEGMRQWEAKWGERVRGAKTMDEYIDGLQVIEGKGRDAKRYNDAESKHNEKFAATAKQTYEDMLREQYRTIENRYPIWQRSRSRGG